MLSDELPNIIKVKDSIIQVSCSNSPTTHTESVRNPNRKARTVGSKTKMKTGR